jgi:hypothetical protein
VAVGLEAGLVLDGEFSALSSTLFSALFDGWGLPEGFDAGFWTGVALDAASLSLSSSAQMPVSHGLVEQHPL